MSRYYSTHPPTHEVASIKRVFALINTDVAPMMEFHAKKQPSDYYRTLDAIQVYGSVAQFSIHMEYLVLLPTMHQKGCSNWVFFSQLQQDYLKMECI